MDEETNHPPAVEEALEAGISALENLKTFDFWNARESDAFQEGDEALEKLRMARSPADRRKQERIEALHRELEANGLTARNLDELVHAAHSEAASEVNNEGEAAQLRYLLFEANWSPADILFRAKEDKAEHDADEPDEEEIERLKDEKRGTYPDKVDIAN